MESPYNKLKRIIADKVSNAAISAGFEINDILNEIEFSKGFGDIYCSIAFKLSKKLKINPNIIATKIVENIKDKEYIKEIKIENGFINFYIDRNWFTKETIYYILKNKSNNIVKKGRNKKIIIEYPSANPVHPIHVGQLRNALLGDILSNVYTACGYNVERQDYIDDLGLQMVEALWGYMHLNPKINDKFDHALGKIYVDVNEYMKTHNIKQELSQLSRLIETEGTLEEDTRKEVATNCVKAQYETLFNYRIFHDVMIWESDIVRNKLLQNALKLLEEKGLIKYITEGEYEGCTIIEFKDFNKISPELKGLKNESKVLIRNNGSATYVAKDIAFHLWKFGILKTEFKYKKFFDKQPNGYPLYTSYPEGIQMDFGNATKVINIIDFRQNYPQLILKNVINAVDKKAANNLIHLSYGIVELEGKKLAGRQGTWIGNTADDLLAEAEEKAYTLIKERFKISDEEKKTLAKEIALSAIKFEFARISPEKNITFSWKWALSFDGNSGPYCQYMNARANRLLEDAHKNIEIRDIKNINTNYIISDIEFELIRNLSISKDIIEKCSIELRPNIITDYIINLAVSFSKFYETKPILKVENDEERTARLALTKAFSLTMSRMLNLLGIAALTKM
ncbi:MAG: arginine--tRNA ligase [Candidatus Micrarchaeia archaeon]